MLGLAADHRPDLVEFMDDAEEGGCDILADILVKHNIFRSREEGRMAIAPALIAHGILKEFPPDYSPPPSPHAREIKYIVTVPPPSL